jgi:FolB domain-containing protein
MGDPTGNRERILIRDLLIRCVVGLTSEERRKSQDVVLNLAIEADLAQACQSDDVADGVDYKVLKYAIIEMLEKSSFRLLERLAARVAEMCLEHPRVQRVAVIADKPGALRYARSVAVEVVRERGADG